MQDIVDSQGNILKSTKNNKIIQFFRANMWNVLGHGVALCITLSGVVNLIMSKGFSASCANFYGIDKKYFSGTEMFEDKLVFIFQALILFIYPFIFSYVNKKLNSKIYVIVTFFATIFILLIQNMQYTVGLINYIPWNWLKRYIDIIYAVSDIVIAYFIIIREFFFEKKKYNNRGQTIIFMIAFIICIFNIITGFMIKINYDISDKKSYEVIEQNRAIISDYNGKFVVMNCEIQDETIILKRGTYSLEEMTGSSITYHTYNKVICK